MKQNLDYYQHFSNADQHAKFKMLRIKYGWEGEGRFWALNNRMATAENCTVDTTKKYQMVTIATDLGMTLKELDEYIDYLDKECDLIIRENDFITTEILQENLGRVMKKREKNQEDYKKRIKESLRNCKRTETEIQTSENIQSKVKETKSKVKEKKEEYIASAEAHSLAILFLSTLPQKSQERITGSTLIKWKKSLDKTLGKYSFTEIESVIKKMRVDSFWIDNFLSPCKLEKKNKEDVPYMEVFLARVNKPKITAPQQINPGLTDVNAINDKILYEKMPGNLMPGDRERIAREHPDWVMGEM